MHEKNAERMQPFTDVPDDQVRAATRTLVAGNQDIAKPEPALELTRMISGFRLLVLPGGHGDYLGGLIATPEGRRYPELTARLIEKFLEE